MNIFLFFSSFIITTFFQSPHDKVSQWGEIQNKLGNKEQPKYFVNETIGFITINHKKNNSESIKLYNSDGNVWYNLAFNVDSIEYKPNTNFAPFAFHVDYYLLALRCKKRNKYYYEVIVNEKNNTIKYVKVNDPSIKFQTWQQHILSAFSVNFDPKKNPIKVMAMSDSKKIAFEANTFYQPLEIKNDWLKIKWEKDNKWYNGWIKWREGNLLLIELFYFA